MTIVSAVIARVRRARAILSAAALASGLAACATVAAVPAGPLKSDVGFTVDLQNSWTRFPKGMGSGFKGSMLTRHGVQLNRIDLITVAAGEPLVLTPMKTDPAPQFTAGQTDLDLVELVTATLTRAGYANVRARDVRPASFAGQPGLRFEITGAYESGLLLRGAVALGKVGDKLHVMWLIAPEIHYFDASAAEFDAMVKSARLNG